MDAYGKEVETANEKLEETEEDPQPNIPLRQRRLPASFWQEPCLSQSPRNSETTHTSVLQPPTHQLSITPLHPWTMNSNTTFPVFLPQRFTAPNHFLLQQNSNSQWIRGSSNCCPCAACLNYSYVIPRMPDVYSGLRYRPVWSVPCCPTQNCTDQSCKLCSGFERWHPERLRHFRLRAARYNAILD